MSGERRMSSRRALLRLARRLWSPLGEVLRACRGHRGRCCRQVGSPCEPVGRSGGYLGRSCRGLGRSGGHLGRSCGRVGQSGEAVGRSGGHLGRSCGVLGRSGGHLGPSCKSVHKPQFEHLATCSPSFPKWGFGNAPFAGKLRFAVGGGPLALHETPATRHAMELPRKLAFPKPHFGNEKALGTSGTRGNLDHTETVDAL